jgi:hypothetical protein
MTAAGQPLGDGSITEEKLRTLVELGGELDDLDFKEYLDLSQQKNKVELVKDFPAMQSLPNGVGTCSLGSTTVVSRRSGSAS